MSPLTIFVNLKLIVSKLSSYLYSTGKNLVILLTYIEFIKINTLPNTNLPQGRGAPGRGSSYDKYIE